MAVDRVSWMIGGPDKDTPGPKHSAEIVRQAFHDSTGGAEGISTVGALKVAALNVPGSAVRVLPGGGIVLNRYESGSGQSYGVRNATQTEVPVTATGSGGGRTDLVVIRVLDAQYEGQYPANPEEFEFTRLEVIEGVPAGTKTFKELNRNYPAIELARIDLPKSRADVQPEFITDLRQVAQPKVKPELRTYALVGDDTDKLTAMGDDQSFSETWPSSADSTQERIFIPEWATRMKILMFWSSVLPSGMATSGRLWVQVGGDENPNNVKTQTVKYSVGTERSRQTYMVADTKWIPPELRGLGQKFIPRANRATSSATQAFLTLDGASAVSIQVEFMERAD